MSAAEHGASLFKIIDATWPRSVDGLRGYVRRASGFKVHAGADFCEPGKYARHR
jgi:hypothetical protein